MGFGFSDWRCGPSRLRSQTYRLSNQRLLVETGLLSRTIDEIDLRTVEDITFHQSFGERLFGLGRIGVVSSEPMGATAMGAGFARARASARPAGRRGERPSRARANPQRRLRGERQADLHAPDLTAAAMDRPSMGGDHGHMDGWRW